MRNGLAALLLGGLSACSYGDAPTPTSATASSEPAPATNPVAARPKLDIGDPAPPLRASNWLKGEAVEKFESGKVYVVDFWATWCGPCIASMPHLAELQTEYKDKGLVAVAFTTKDPNNPLEDVKSFVESQAKEYPLRFAFAASEDTYDAYMTAAGQNGIPCSFVIDKQGKIAYIGHPLVLDEVLPKVIAGTWRGQADIEAIEKASEALNAIYELADKDPSTALSELDEYAEQYPEKAKRPEFRVNKMLMMVSAKKFDEAKKTTEELIPYLVEKRKDSSLFRVRGIWASKQLNPDRQYIELSVRAAEEYLKLKGENDILALIGVANSQFAAGNKDKAIELGEKALKIAKTDDQKEAVEEQLKLFRGEKKQ